MHNLCSVEVKIFRFMETLTYVLAVFANLVKPLGFYQLDQSIEIFCPKELFQSERLKKKQCQHRASKSSTNRIAVKTTPPTNSFCKA